MNSSENENFLKKKYRTPKLWFKNNNKVSKKKRSTYTIFKSCLGQKFLYFLHSLWEMNGGATDVCLVERDHF